MPRSRSTSSKGPRPQRPGRDTTERRQRMRRAGGLSGPANVVAGIGAWYDFSDATTLFTDTARTTPVSADAQTIKGVTDKSGAGCHLSEGTNPPAYKTGILNSQSVARFATGKSLTSANYPISNGQAMTVFAVLTNTTGITTNTYVGWGETGGASQVMGFRGGATGSNTLYSQFYDGSHNVVTFPPDLTQSSVVTAVGESSTDYTASYVNSFPVSTTAGAFEMVASSGTFQLNTVCDVAEFIAFGRRLTNTEIAAVQLYLTDKWNVRDGLSVSGLVAWYDFGAISTLWKDTGRTSAVTADADVVKGVTDRSGVGNHLSEATNGPAYKVNIQNSKSVARFDGTNDQLIGAMSADTTKTVILAFKKRTAVGAGSMTVFAAGIASQYYTNSTASPGMNWYSTVPGGVELKDASNDPPTTAAVHVLRQNGATNLDIMSGLGESHNFVAANAELGTSVAFSLGGEPVGASNWGDYDIYEVLMYSTALTDAQISTIVSYLDTKWGTTSTIRPLPSSVSGLVAWYDFNDVSSTWKDTGRTSQAASDADVILGVTDKSGSGKHLSEATNGPTLKYAIQNGKHVARFDGTNDTLGNSAMSADTSWTVFILAQKRSAPDATSKTLFALAGGSQAQLYTSTADSLGTGYGWYSNQALGVVTLAGTAANATVCLLRINSAASLDAYFDGGTPTNFNPNDLVTTGTQYAYGSTASPSQFSDHDIGEVCVYNSALAAADINTIGTYLAAKWGTTWTTVT